MIAFYVVLAACSKTDQEDYSKLRTDMSKTEVETTLGKPTGCFDTLGMSSCTWDDGKAFTSAQYAADKALLFSGQGFK